MRYLAEIFEMVLCHASEWEGPTQQEAADRVQPHQLQLH